MWWACAPAAVALWEGVHCLLSRQIKHVSKHQVSRLRRSRLLLSQSLLFPSHLSSCSVLADGCNYHEVKSVLVGFKSRTPRRNDACADADVFGQVCLYIWAVWVGLLHRWIKYSSCSRHVSSLLWVLCMSFNWATLFGHTCTYCTDQRRRQTFQHRRLSLDFEI